jgi:hypothetical protein
MTPQQLISEGRKLERPCLLLRPTGTGAVAAGWYERDEGEIESTGHRCWLTVDIRNIPGLRRPVRRYMKVLTDETSDGGRVQFVSSWPRRAGTRLYAHAASVLPPIDAVFARGSEAVGQWMASHGWNRRERYNDNFKGRATIEPYERLWMQEFPIYFSKSDIYAVLGGRHWPCADHDWHHLIDEQLMVFTIRDAEPWVEAWRTRAGQFRVIQRIT